MCSPALTSRWSAATNLHALTTVVCSDKLKFQLPYLVKAMQILLTTLYLTHLMACGFYYVGAREYYGKNDTNALSWLPDAKVPLAEDDGVLEWDTVGPPYVAALYWTCTTITTVGYGDLAPVTTAERLYAIVKSPPPQAVTQHLQSNHYSRVSPTASAPPVALAQSCPTHSLRYAQFCMVFGTGLFGYIMGSVTALLSSAATKQDQYHLKLQQLQSFMSSKKLPHELQVRIRRYFRFYWERNVKSDDGENEVMSSLSTSLRQETLRFLYSATIAQLPIFQVVSDNSYHDDLLLSMHPMVTCPNEEIIKQGTPGSEFFVVTKGQFGVFYRPNSRAGNGSVSSFTDVANGAVVSAPRLIARLCPGDMIGEIALLRPEDLGLAAKGQHSHTRTATIKALDYSELFMVDARDLQSIWSKFLPLKEHIVKSAKSRTNVACTNRPCLRVEYELLTWLSRLCGYSRRLEAAR